MKAKIYKVKPYTNEIIRGKFEKVKDLRVSGMVDHRLVDLLIIIMLSIVSGVEKLDEIVTYGKKRLFLRQIFAIKKIPSKSTLSRVLNMIDGEEVVEIIIEMQNDNSERQQLCFRLERQSKFVLQASRNVLQ